MLVETAFLEQPERRARRRSRLAEIRNPKSEIRKKSEIRNPKPAALPEFAAAARASLIRASDFGFRISDFIKDYCSTTRTRINCFFVPATELSLRKNTVSKSFVDIAGKY